jgi:hypothetical protein
MALRDASLTPAAGIANYLIPNDTGIYGTI